MTERTTQTTIDWHWLPELPPEPEDEQVEPDYLIAIDGIAFSAWYEGEGYWFDRNGYNRTKKVYAWAKWPEAPAVRRK